MGKVKKEKLDETVEAEVSVKEEDTYDDKVRKCSIIAKPMAPKKLTKKCLKLIKKGNQVKTFHDKTKDSQPNHLFIAAKQKTFLRNGLKDVQSRLKKGETG